MKHMTLPRFWDCYAKLPAEIRKLADKNFEMLKRDSSHPSLQFKQVGRTRKLWSVRVGNHYRALGDDKAEGILWFWIVPHAVYDALLSRKGN
jgi:hypothetical protein